MKVKLYFLPSVFVGTVLLLACTTGMPTVAPTTAKEPLQWQTATPTATSTAAATITPSATPTEEPDPIPGDHFWFQTSRQGWSAGLSGSDAVTISLRANNVPGDWVLAPGSEIEETWPKETPEEVLLEIAGAGLRSNGGIWVPVRQEPFKIYLPTIARSEPPTATPIPRPPTPTPEEHEPTNLARDAEAHASTEFNEYPATNAVDGNSGTWWASTGPPPQWIQVNLQHEYFLTEVRAQVALLPEMQTTFEVKVWVDGVEVASDEFNVVNGDWIEIGLPTEGKNVALQFTSATNAEWPALYEFQVWGR